MIVNYNKQWPYDGRYAKGVFFLAFVLFSCSAWAQMKVNGRYLYDECGNKVVIRGTNTMTLYWDGYGPDNGEDWNNAGDLTFSQLARTGANTARIFWHYKHGAEGWAIPPEALEATVKNCVKYGMIAMPSLWEATGNEPKSEFDNIVDYWTQPAIVAIINKYEDKFILNIANEWNARDASGDKSSNAVRKVYADAITKIRNAGIKVPIVIDGPERWSQNEQSLYDHAAYWLNHDPLKNVIFSMHMYDPMVGTSFPAPESRLKSIMDWFVSNDLCFMWGEFAEDGHNGNDIAFEFIMKYAQEKEMGWLAWVWWCCTGEGSRKTIARSKMYGDWYDSYASMVAATSPYSIENTSVKYQCGETAAVAGVSIDRSSASVEVFSSLKLNAQISPANASNQLVTWSSSNPSVATVDPTGSVTGQGVGTAQITVKTDDGNKTATATITVTEGATNYVIADFDANVPTVGAIEAGKVQMYAPGGTASIVNNPASSSANSSANVAKFDRVAGNYKIIGFLLPTERNLNAFSNLSFKIYGTDISEMLIIVEDASKNVALEQTLSVNIKNNWSTVNVPLNGAIPYNAKNVIIFPNPTKGSSETYYLDDVVLKAKTSPNTNISVTGVAVSPTAASVVVGATQQLTAAVSPSDATNKGVNWSSSNTSVATVSDAGLVTGVAAGSATVTATTADGNKTSSSAVTVTSTPPPPPPPTGTVFYEAEQNTSGSGGNVDTFRGGYTGSGYYDFGGSGSYVEWSNISPGAGSYTITIRYANGSSANRPAVVTLNGEPVETVDFPTTNSWTNWWLATTESKAFNGGSNTIRITASTGSGGPNVDNIILTPTGAAARQDQGVVDKLGQSTAKAIAQEFKLYPNPSTGMVRVLLPEQALVQVHNSLGQLVLEQEVQAGQSSLDLSKLGHGMHMVSTTIQGRRQVQRLILK